MDHVVYFKCTARSLNNLLLVIIIHQSDDQDSSNWSKTKKMNVDQSINFPSGKNPFGTTTELFIKVSLLVLVSKSTFKRRLNQRNAEDLPQDVLMRMSWQCFERP